MKEIIHNLVDRYPWVAFALVWLLLIGGVLLEYQMHRNKGVAAGGFFFLICFLAYAISTIDAFGIIRWLLVLLVLGIGWLAIKSFVGESNRQQNKDNSGQTTNKFGKPKNTTNDELKK